MKKNNNWFEFAKEDLIVARASLEQLVYNQVCFHAQQGVEKMLKGFLAVKDKDIPRIHSIGGLLKLCAEIEPRFNKLVDTCIKLDVYYIPTRYPDALPGVLPEGMPSEDDAKEAISALEKVMDFIKKA